MIEVYDLDRRSLDEQERRTGTLLDVEPARVVSHDGDLLSIETTLPTADAWPWFTDPALLSRWWVPEAATDIRTGGAYRFSWPEAGWTLTGTYLVVEPPHRLAFTWSWDHDDLPPRRVDVGFGGAEEASKVSIRHAYGNEEERDGYRDGWLHFLGVLAETIGDDS